MEMPTSAKTRSQDKGSAVITLLPEQTIRGVKLLHAVLCAVLNGAARVRLAAAEVACVDTATLQLLCAFMLEGRQRGVEVEWDTPSEALSSAARLLGVSEVLALE
ncbi:MAG: STAS domain-containing protein [Nitrococcus mobilis]|nr:STAS domain-containing protein [Nitrococcus mobilis]